MPAAYGGVLAHHLDYLVSDVASADETTLGNLGRIDRREIAILLPMVGLIVFAVITAIMLVRTRRRTARLEGASRDEIIGLHDRLDRANALLLSERQVLVDWLAASNRPSIDGDLGTLGLPSRIACSPSVHGSTPRRRARWSVRSVLCAHTVTRLRRH